MDGLDQTLAVGTVLALGAVLAVGAVVDRISARIIIIAGSGC